MRGEAASSMDFMFMETSDRPVSAPTLTVSLVCSIEDRYQVANAANEMTMSSFTLELNA